MKKLYIVAALLMATTSANAGGITFQINGERIRVESPRNCNALSCIKITAPGYNGTLGNVDLKGVGSKSKDDDDSVATAPAKPATPGPAQAAAPQPAAAPAPAPTTTVAATPAQTEAAPPAPPPPPAPLAAAPAPAPQPARAAAAAPASDPNSPLGVWATEENKGNVRIEECGANLCGYSVNSGERILINMKPQGGKWTGRIHDPNTGRNYDSTIALKGSDTLKVQGCAFGGMFCGGQTWKRVS
jgi:uncharacterized protein (DUF2147 family)